MKKQTNQGLSNGILDKGEREKSVLRNKLIRQNCANDKSLLITQTQILAIPVWFIAMIFISLYLHIAQLTCISDSAGALKDSLHI